MPKGLTVRLHPSSLEDWQGCGKRFEYSTVLRERPAYRHPAGVNGTAVHRVIHLIHQDGLWEAQPDLVAHLYAEAWREAVHRPKSEEERGVPVFWGRGETEETAFPGYARDALAILNGYRRDPRNQQARLLLSEGTWRATFGGFDWEGTLDQARLTPEGVELVDLKTSAEPLQGAALAMWPQGLTYAMALGHAVFRPADADDFKPWTPLQLEVRRVVWVQLREYVPYAKKGRRRDGTEYRPGDLRGPVFYPIEVTRAGLASHAREIGLFARDVQDGRFPRRPSNHQCAYRCKFVERCTKDFNGTLEGLDLGLASHDGEDT